MRGLLAEDASRLTSVRSEKYYAAIKDDPRLHVKLTGSWETLVGSQDTFGKCFSLYYAVRVVDPFCFKLQSIYWNMKTMLVTTRQ